MVGQGALKWVKFLVKSFKLATYSIFRLILGITFNFESGITYCIFELLKASLY